MKTLRELLVDTSNEIIEYSLGEEYLNKYLKDNFIFWLHSFIDKKMLPYVKMRFDNLLSSEVMLKEYEKLVSIFYLDNLEFSDNVNDITDNNKLIKNEISKKFKDFPISEIKIFGDNVSSVSKQIRNLLYKIYGINRDNGNVIGSYVGSIFSEVVSQKIYFSFYSGKITEDILKIGNPKSCWILSTEDESLSASNFEAQNYPPKCILYYKKINNELKPHGRAFIFWDRVANDYYPIIFNEYNLDVRFYLSAIYGFMYKSIDFIEYKTIELEAETPRYNKCLSVNDNVGVTVLEYPHNEYIYEVPYTEYDNIELSKYGIGAIFDKYDSDEITKVELIESIDKKINKISVKELKKQFEDNYDFILRYTTGFFENDKNNLDFYFIEKGIEKGVFELYQINELFDYIDNYVINNPITVSKIHNFYNKFKDINGFGDMVKNVDFTLMVNFDFVKILGV